MYLCLKCWDRVMKMIASQAKALARSLALSDTQHSQESVTLQKEPIRLAVQRVTHVCYSPKSSVKNSVKTFKDTML